MSSILQAYQHGLDPHGPDLTPGPLPPGEMLTYFGPDPNGPDPIPGPPPPWETRAV
ncbi:hypothetical protein N7G274_009347 [Stereocaulon virgatum]|uniref:Uncharacterized protein n=1 Tax=Stereocaulon virgatum TaxID=373712 RepID=A0ABR3ZW74_9LECA